METPGRHDDVLTDYWRSVVDYVNGAPPPPPPQPKRDRAPGDSASSVHAHGKKKMMSVGAEDAQTDSERVVTAVVGNVLRAARSESGAAGAAYTPATVTCAGSSLAGSASSHRSARRRLFPDASGDEDDSFAAYLAARAAEADRTGQELSWWTPLALFVLLLALFAVAVRPPVEAAPLAMPPTLVAAEAVKIDRSSPRRWWRLPTGLPLHPDELIWPATW